MTWRNPRLIEHFGRHGADFGSKTALAYQRTASKFLKGTPGKGVLQRVCPNGDIFRFNPNTDAFGVIS